jgi:hypothetical protein
LQIKNFDNYSYVDAIATYEKVAEKGYKDEKMFQKTRRLLFYSRFDQGREMVSALWDEPSSRARVLLQVFPIFKAVGNYAKADKMLEQFIATATDQRF